MSNSLITLHSSWVAILGTKYHMNTTFLYLEVLDFTGSTHAVYYENFNKNMYIYRSVLSAASFF